MKNQAEKFSDFMSQMFSVGSANKGMPSCRIRTDT